MDIINKKVEKIKKSFKRIFSGVVIKSKMNKTVVVRVDRVKIHPRYQKRYTVSEKYKVHDEKNQLKEGDKVKFIECRPLSKDKKWRALYK
ncbi:30S ribosomal protein S17 [Candidatus Falkowbacteria bacterium]|nr:30S ribosomal protein S17 [Candidatus Falkowbacteria bacterium]